MVHLQRDTRSVPINICRLFFVIFFSSLMLHMNSLILSSGTQNYHKHQKNKYDLCVMTHVQFSNNNRCVAIYMTLIYIIRACILKWPFLYKVKNALSKLKVQVYTDGNVNEAVRVRAIWKRKNPNNEWIYIVYSKNYQGIYILQLENFLSRPNPSE